MEIVNPALYSLQRKIVSETAHSSYEKISATVKEGHKKFSNCNAGCVTINLCSVSLLI